MHREERTILSHDRQFHFEMDAPGFLIVLRRPDV